MTFHLEKFQEVLIFIYLMDAFLHYLEMSVAKVGFRETVINSSPSPQGIFPRKMRIGLIISSPLCNCDRKEFHSSYNGKRNKFTIPLEYLQYSTITLHCVASLNPAKLYQMIVEFPIMRSAIC